MIAEPQTRDSCSTGRNSSFVLRHSSHSTRALLERGVALIGRADAEFLLGELTGKPRHALYESDFALSPELEDRFCALAERAASGTPVEYLLNTAAFMDFRLHVDKRVLIPRPETEELVTRALARSAVGGRRSAVLDLGTGSGCIAIALARALPEARIVATDISPAALEVAAVNIARHSLADRIQVIESDLFSAMRNAECGFRNSAFDIPKSALDEFDLIVSNPPYIPTAVFATLSPSVRDHEPLLALDGGTEGMSVIQRIIRESPAFMTAGALLALEIDPAIVSAVRRLLPDAVIEQDIQGLERFCFWSRVETTDKHR